jgi:DNA-binding winged helix-turn-helix (wHTH) protein
MADRATSLPPQERSPDWPPRTFAFGPFKLQPERQSLLKHGRPVRIGGRALDLLTALVQRPGDLVSKGELLAIAWPAVFVDEANLKVNIATIRRLLDEDANTPRYIATVVGRGYRFIAAVRATTLTER